METNREVVFGAKRNHNKASEIYLTCTFNYSTGPVIWDVPIEYRRTGVDLSASSDMEIQDYASSLYSVCHPSKWDLFRREAELFWKTKSRAQTTKAFFDVLVSDFEWKSIETDLPKNPNWARRIQDLKEFGFTISTDTNRIDKKTKKSCTHLQLIPIPRGGLTGYEVWSKELRTRIINILNGYDAFEAKVTNKSSLLPDHKFPEIRWDDTVRRNDLETLNDVEIREDFQLLNNQRNQQKREVCRTCYQSNVRPGFSGITYFSTGTSAWDSSIPRKGPAARRGCLGCPWYDIEAWRQALQRELDN